MIPNIFNFSKNPVNAIVGYLLFLAFGLQLSFGYSLTEFDYSLTQIWNGDFWIVLIQGFLFYDWQHFLMNVLAIMLLGVPFERRYGKYEYIALILVVFFAVPQLINLMFEFTNFGSNGVLGLLLILKMTGKYPKLSSSSFRASVYLFFVLLLYLLYYGQNPDSLASQIGHIQFLIGGLFAFLWRLMRYVVKEKRVHIVPHFYVGMSLLILSTAYAFPLDARWQLVQIENDLDAGNDLAAQERFEELSSTDDQLTKWLLVYLQLSRNIMVQPLDEMIKILKDDPQDMSQVMLAEIYMGMYDIKYKSHDVAYRIIRSVKDNQAKALNLQAMLYCGSDNYKHWDIVKGTSIAFKINQNSDWASPALLDTYAACLARDDRWVEAQKWIMRAWKIQKSKTIKFPKQIPLLNELTKNRDLILQKSYITYGDDS